MNILFEKFAAYEISTEQASLVREGGWVRFQLADGSKIDVWERESGVGCQYGIKDGNGSMQCWSPPPGARML